MNAAIHNWSLAMLATILAAPAAVADWAADEAEAWLAGQPR